jgi:hypothetical protein
MTVLPLLLALSIAAEPEAPKAPAPAKAAITAPLACLHCSYGIGEDCAACLKLDDKTPILISGKAAAALLPHRFSKQVITLEGTLSVTKDKQIQLTTDVAPKIEKK